MVLDFAVFFGVLSQFINFLFIISLCICVLYGLSVISNHYKQNNCIKKKLILPKYIYTIVAAKLLGYIV